MMRSSECNYDDDYYSGFLKRLRFLCSLSFTFALLYLPRYEYTFLSPHGLSVSVQSRKVIVFDRGCLLSNAARS